MWLLKNKKIINILGMIIIIIAGILAYLNSFHCSFNFDDYPNITDNPAIRKLSDIYSWWNFNPRRPIGFLTFALNYHYHGIDVVGYHLVNLVIHLANGLLVYWLVKQTFQTPAFKNKYDDKMQMMVPFFAALLFIVHPLMTEAVTYIVQRLVSLASMFYLLTLNLYIKGRLTYGNIKKKILLFGLALFSAILSLLTKEIAYTIVAALILYEIYFFNSSLKIKKNKWIFIILLVFVISLVLFFITVRYDKFFKIIGPTEGNNYSITTLTYLLTEFRVLVTYIRLMFIPINQTFDYYYPLSTGFFEMKTIGSFLFLVTLFILGIWLFKKNKWISFGIMWFFITISVQSGIFARPNVIFEHRAYLSLVGYLFVLTGIFMYFDKFRDVRSIMIAVLITMATVFGVFTYQRNKVWTNTYTLWVDCVKKSPEKPRPLNNYGKVLNDYGDYQGALIYLNKAITLNPNYADPYNNRGLSKINLKMYDEAKIDLDKAISLNNKDASAFNSRGISKFYLKDTFGALTDFNYAIYLKPDFAMAYSNKANIMADYGKYNDALELYNKAISLKPDYVQAIKNRENLLKKMEIKK